MPYRMTLSFRHRAIEVHYYYYYYYYPGGPQGAMPPTVDKFFYTLSIPIIDGLYDECSHQNSLNLYLNSQKAFASGGLRPQTPYLVSVFSKI